MLQSEKTYIQHLVLQANSLHNYSYSILPYQAKEFLEYEYGITLTEEKALIHPQMLIKAMDEYAQMVVKNLHKPPVIKSVCEHQWVEMHGNEQEYFQCSKCYERG